MDAIVCDPPYANEDWHTKKGFTKSGLGGQRQALWVTYTFSTNRTCTVCGGRQRGKVKCYCEIPVWDLTIDGFDHVPWLTEAYRILKPQGVVKVFCSTKYYHKAVKSMIDVGFKNVDLAAWGYGTGFPKSSNLVDSWKGWGTALKPSWEPIVLGRKNSE